MNISGIRTYAGFYDYNTIKQSKMRSRRIQEAKVATEHGMTVAEEEHVTRETVVVSGTDNGDKDFAKQHEPDVVYERKGAESDIFKLDIEKVISDVKKDEVLLEYQFFVNSAGGLGNPAASNVTEQFVL